MESCRESPCHKDILLNEYRSDVPCYTLSWFEERNISREKLARWKEKYNLIYPWDLPYNTVRLSYNRLVQFFPLIIAKIRDIKSIQWSLKFCHRYNVPFSIRSGAHDWLGFSSSTGLVIDLSKYDASRILDLKKGLVEVQAGARIGEVVKELSKYGIAVPAGTCQNTSIGGLTLGGGVGFLTRKYGLTLDNVKGINIILADGTYLETCHDNYPDLFWALRGGGNGNFGVVTSFVFQAHPIKKVVLFELWFEYRHLVEMLDFWQDWSLNVDKRITSELDIANDKTNPRPILVTGQAELDKDDVEKSLLGFTRFNPLIKVWTSSYPEAVRNYATPLNKTNWFSYQNTGFLPRKLPKEALEIIKTHLQQSPEGLKLALLALGGKLAQVNPDETAFPWRESPHWLHLQAAWRDSYQGNLLIDLNRKLFVALKPYLINPETGTIQAYVNFHSFEVGDSYPQAYWGSNYPRLQKIKRKYDPDNFFTTPQPIIPALNSSTR